MIERHNKNSSCQQLYNNDYTIEAVFNNMAAALTGFIEARSDCDL